MASQQKASKDEEIVVEVQPEDDSPRSYIERVLPDAGTLELFSGFIEEINFEVACVSAKGRRRYMKDEVSCMELPIENYGDVGFCAVYDGHGSRSFNEAAKYVKQRLVHRFGNSLARLCSSKHIEGIEERAEAAANTVKEVFRSVDDSLHRCGYPLDKFLCFRPVEMCQTIGCTASVALLLDSHYIFANAGDSRMILVRDGSIVFESTDHKPRNEEEQIRIKLSRNVFVKEGWMFASRGYQRHALSVSRGFGDFFFKERKGLDASEQAVTAEPDVTIVPRDESDEFIVVASDGLWNFVSSEEVVDFVRLKLFQKGVSTEECAAELLEYCFVAKKSTDNISIIILKL